MTETAGEELVFGVGVHRAAEALTHLPKIVGMDEFKGIPADQLLRLVAEVFVMDGLS